MDSVLRLEANDMTPPPSNADLQTLGLIFGSSTTLETGTSQLGRPQAYNKDTTWVQVVTGPRVCDTL